METEWQYLDTQKIWYVFNTYNSVVTIKQEVIGVQDILDDDAVIDIAEESVCSDDVNNELSGADQTDYASQKSKLVMMPFYYSPSVTTPTDGTAKHYMNEYNMETIEDTGGSLVST